MARFYALAAMGSCALLSAAPAAANSNDDWATASDVVRAALVVAAVGSPIVQDDGQGLREAGYSLLTCFSGQQHKCRSLPRLGSGVRIASPAPDFLRKINSMASAFGRNVWRQIFLARPLSPHCLQKNSDIWIEPDSGGGVPILSSIDGFLP